MAIPYPIEARETVLNERAATARRPLPGQPKKQHLITSKVVAPT